MITILCSLLYYVKKILHETNKKTTNLININFILGRLKAV